MLSAALTGNVAAGKSTVAGLWRAQGVPVISADALARTVVEPGSEGLAAVVQLLGPDVLAPDGSMDRAAVRDRVFKDAEARRTLEMLLHPRIAALRAEWVREREAEGVPLAVAEIPLLFEAGLAREFDATVLVDAPEDERLRRLVEVRGLDRDEARRIMEAQMDAQTKRGLADFVVENGGTMPELEVEAARVLTALWRRALATGT